MFETSVSIKKGNSNNLETIFPISYRTQIDRDPVVDKICIRKLNGYIFFFFKYHINENVSLEKSLTSLITRVIQLPSSAKFFYFCC